MHSISTPDAGLDDQGFASDSGMRTMRLHGRLEMQTTGVIWRKFQQILGRPDLRILRLDTSELGYVDSSGLALLVDLEERLRARGGELQLVGLSPELQQSLDHFRELSQAEARPGKRSGPLEKIGRGATILYHDLRELAGYVGLFTAAFAQSLRHPRSIRWRDFWLSCETVGANAVPIIALIGFLMGLIISFQSAMPLRMFGAEIYVARLLGLSMIRELGPLVTAIILAGRSGASFAAELGTMKINEELDALTTMGLDPVRLLVIPRMLAAMLMTPLLTMVFIVFSLIGGAVVMLSLGYPLVTYTNQVTMSVGMGDLFNGLGKGFVFSILVGWIGCVRGLQTGQGAWAVGAATTSAVVSGIILIAVTDGIFAVLYYVFNY